MCEGAQKILGVLFGREEGAALNWGQKVQAVKTRLGMWRTRGLSITGKVMALKADVLPSLNHLALVYPVPAQCARLLEREVFSFIWGGKTELVSRETMRRDVGRGGRGVPWFTQKLMAMYVAFQARLVIGEFDHKAAFLARF